MLQTVLIGDIEKKVRDIESLPTFQEVMDVFNFYEDEWKRIENREKTELCEIWTSFCRKNGAFNVYNVEFVDALAKNIRKLGVEPIVEVCAGNGKLSYQLRNRGIDIVATDDYSWGLSKDESLVKRLSHIETLRRYKPRLVVASWIPNRQSEFQPKEDGTRIGNDILNFPSVMYFVHIGEDHWRTRRTYNRKHWEITALENIEEFSVCVTDYRESVDHSMVRMFKRVEK